MLISSFFPTIGTGVAELLKWASLDVATTEEQAVLLWYLKSSYCILIVPKSLVATLVVLHFYIGSDQAPTYQEYHKKIVP